MNRAGSWHAGDGQLPLKRPLLFLLVFLSIDSFANGSAAQSPAGGDEAPVPTDVSTVHLALLQPLSTFRAELRKQLPAGRFRDSGSKHGGEVVHTVTWEPTPATAELLVDGSTITVSLPGTLSPVIKLGSKAGAVYEKSGCKRSTPTIVLTSTVALREGSLRIRAGSATVGRVGRCMLDRTTKGDAADIFNDGVNFVTGKRLYPDLPESVDIGAIIKQRMAEEARARQAKLAAAIEGMLDPGALLQAVRGQLESPLELQPSVWLRLHPQRVRLRSFKGETERIRIDGAIDVMPALHFGTRPDALPAAPVGDGHVQELRLRFGLLLPSVDALGAPLETSVQAGTGTGYAILPVAGREGIAVLRHYDDGEPTDVVYLRDTPAAGAVARSATPQPLLDVLDELGKRIESDVLGKDAVRGDVERLRRSIERLRALVTALTAADHRLQGAAGTTVSLRQPALRLEQVSVSELGIEITLQASTTLSITIDYGS